MWVHSQAGEGDVVGDLLSSFDPENRRGWNLSVVSNHGVVSSPLSNDRQLHFGIDNARLDSDWTSHGRPGTAVKISALHVSEGNLYAGTMENQANQTGHLWRFQGGERWQDLGASPDGCNAVQSITRFGGALYCSTGRYNPMGSVLGPAKNPTPGGHVYRITADGQWIDCGLPGEHGARPEAEQVPGHFTDKADETIGLIPFRGELLAVSHHRQGVWRWDGNRDWKWIGPACRLFSLTVFHGNLYCLVNGGPVLRYDGDGQWADCGKPKSSTQTYSAAVYANQLYVGTWPEADVFRYAGGTQWDLVGRLGFEREVMGMNLYNGKLYAGSLPMANVFRMDGNHFAFLGNLDNAPVVLRRVWSMAVYQGRLFAGTLPSGLVKSRQAGVMATADRAFPSGWHHVAAVRHQDKLTLYIDGKQIAASSPFAAGDFDLSCDRPLRIGLGQHAALNGALAEVRLYNRALDTAEIQQLAQQTFA